MRAGYLKNTPGSALIEMGQTRVICSATYEEKVPFFLKNSGRGWVTAEYAMLPGSTGNTRVRRERLRLNSRNTEIQRLLGRALRSVFDLKEIAGFSIQIDADVIQADGGTRCAAVNGGVVALIQALRHMVYENLIPDLPKITYIAAVSLGVRGNDILLDLDYGEDSSADADINVVSSETGELVEVQALTEKKSVSLDMFQKIISLGIQNNLEIISRLKEVVASIPVG